MSQNPRKKASRFNSNSINSQSQSAGTSNSRSLCAEICPICLQVFVEPYSTACGHTFCHACILRHISQRANCPQCETDLDLSNQNHLIPNHTVAALIENARRTRQNLSTFKRIASEFSQDFHEDYNLLDQMITPLDSVETINNAIVKLKRRRTETSLSDQKKKSVLLNEFFDIMIAKRNKTIEKAMREIQILNADKKHELLKDNASTNLFLQVVPDSTPSNQVVNSVCPIEKEQIQNLKKRIQPKLDSLESSYFELEREASVLGDTKETGSLGIGSNLDKFSNILTGISKYTKIRKLATLSYSVEPFPNSSIVSSIEFDRDGEFFVVAGVSNKIKLHDFNAVAYGNSDNHYPLTQLQCSSKISNVSYNTYQKSLLSSSDYDGHVRLWDVDMCKNVRTYSEHEKRCWTVQFNNKDPHLMASGSDDAKVKIWSTNMASSVCTIDARVNVCCVYFSPTSRHYFVFGSADHCVHLYDFRNPSQAVRVFHGHLKAVSYVKYCNDSEIVSASVDSTLRLWDVKTGTCRQVMSGHQNSKNFTGLATDGNHVVCGSENNSLYTYYKNIKDPVLRYDFATRQTDPRISEITLMPNEQSSSDFVSAVCWRKNSNIVVAASSQGNTHVLELL